MNTAGWSVGLIAERVAFARRRKLSTAALHVFLKSAFYRDEVIAAGAFLSTAGAPARFAVSLVQSERFPRCDGVREGDVPSLI